MGKTLLAIPRRIAAPFDLPLIQRQHFLRVLIDAIGVTLTLPHLSSSITLIARAWVSDMFSIPLR